MGTPVGKDEFLSNKTSEKLLPFPRLMGDGSKSTMPVKMKSFAIQKGKMFGNTNQSRFKTPDAKAK